LHLAQLCAQMKLPPLQTRQVKLLDISETQLCPQVAARTGAVVLFESWLRHEVPANESAGERVSISFNYSWF